MCKRLGFSVKESIYFCDLVDKEHARSRTQKSAAARRVRTANLNKDQERLATDTFSVIAEWYHLAVLELLTLKGHDSTVATLAPRLGITPIQAQAALDRLERLDMVRKNGQSYIATKTRTLLAGGIPSEAVRRFHRQYLERAALALDRQHMDEREFGTVVLSIDNSRLPELKERLAALRDEFCSEARAHSEKDQLYCYAFQLYRLTETSP